MKKLMVAVAVIAMAVGAQAAAINWETSGVMDSLNKDPYSGALTMYYSVKDSGEWAVATEGTMNAGAFNFMLDDSKFVAGTTYSFYFTMDAGDALYTSVTKNKKANATSTQFVDFGGNGEWAAVPEPTSGLLLLLGVAGLALRRRRA